MGDVARVKMFSGGDGLPSAAAPARRGKTNIQTSRWIKVGGRVNPNRAAGRNNPWPFGSGKTFKKCCLAVWEE